MNQFNMKTVSSKSLQCLFLLALYVSTIDSFSSSSISLTCQGRGRTCYKSNSVFPGYGTLTPHSLQHQSNIAKGVTAGNRQGTSLSLSPETIFLAKTIAPKIGVLTATALYFAPAAAVLNAVRNNEIGDLNPLPLAIMSLVCMSWTAYGLILRDPYVVLSNIAGTIGSIGYVVYLLPLLQGNQKQLRSMQGVVMAGTGTILSLWTLLGMSGAPVSSIYSALGLFASVVTIILCGSPLSTIKTVVKTQDSKSILGPLTVAQVINTGLWAMYGFAIHDKLLWVPNFVGLGLGLVQLLLKVVYSPRRQRLAPASAY